MIKAILGLVVGLVLGVGIGGGFTMHEADQVIDTITGQRDAVAKEYAELKQNYDALNAEAAKMEDALRMMNGTAAKLLDRVHQDDSALGGMIDDATNAAGESTVIYERSPQIQIRFTGIRGLPIIPLPGNGQNLPRVIIPGRVKPVILAPDGDTRQAVFYYADKRNHLHGPYAPEVVRP